MNSALSIMIAGIGIHIEANEASLLEQLNKRYAGFTASTIQPALYMRIVWAGQLSTDPCADPKLLFQSHQVDIIAPGYSGWIDLSTNCAELKVSSQVPIEDVDYFLRVATALLAFDAGGLLFHAAGIIHRSAGYAFLGHSGAGKTTVARFSTTDTILNDDLVVLLPDKERSTAGSGWKIFATPFWNPSQVRPKQNQACLVGLFRLMKDTKVALEKMRSGQAVGELISCVPIIPTDPHRRSLLLERVSLLVSEISVYCLYFKKEASFWNAIEELNLNHSDS